MITPRDRFFFYFPSFTYLFFGHEHLRAPFSTFHAFRKNASSGEIDFFPRHEWTLRESLIYQWASIGRFMREGRNCLSLSMPR